MRWVAPTANQTLEKRLWGAADQFRANSGLKAGQYSTPVLGLIFLLQNIFKEKELAESVVKESLTTAAHGKSRRGNSCFSL